MEAKTLGTYIREYRKAKGLTQHELAARVGVSHIAISAIERGASVPTADHLFDIAAELDMSLDYLIYAGSHFQQPHLPDELNELWVQLSDRDRKIAFETMVSMLSAMQRNDEAEAAE